MLSLLVGHSVPELLAAYLIANIAYTTYLKKLAIVDTIVLASMYTLRILVGGAATSIVISNWLLAFSTFLFLSLALLKRFAEVSRSTSAVLRNRRGYLSEDVASLQSLGVSSGYMTLLVLVLYLNGPDVTGLYQRPDLVWLCALVLCAWISRIWLLAGRGEVTEDPVVFAARDRWTWGALSMFVMIVVFAS